MQLATKNDDWIAATMADVMATVVNAAARMPARVSDRVWVRHRQAGEGGWCSASSHV